MYELLLAASLLGTLITCNSHNYDMVYAAIVQEALKRLDSCAPIEVEYRSSKGELVFTAPGCESNPELRNRSIRLLRQICNGQLSSWEKGK